jgi:hypothetical protein
LQDLRATYTIDYWNIHGPIGRWKIM